MPKEQFFIDGSREVLKLIEQGGRKAGIGRGHAFEDFLTLVVCALAGQTLEEEYLSVVQKGYQKGAKGKRGIDDMTQAFAEMVSAMDGGFIDVLGDIYQGGITYGEAGQFFTPTPISDLMGALVTRDIDKKPDVSKNENGNENNTIGSEPDLNGEFKSVCDPASGSGRILLSIAKNNPRWEFTGQDVDPRCAKMTAINLGLNGLRGWAVWQNSLTLETFRVFKVGFNLHGGVIEDFPIVASPFNYAAQARNQPENDATQSKAPPSESPIKNETTASQLDLF